MRIQCVRVGLWACLVLSCGVAGAADPELPSLLMFGNDPPQGRWRLEVLEATDPEVLAMTRQTGSVSVCMNAATEMGKRASQGSTSERCTTKTLQDTRNVAPIVALRGRARPGRERFRAAQVQQAVDRRIDELAGCYAIEIDR